MDVTQRKLGKQTPVFEKKTPKLANYLNSDVLDPAPIKQNWGERVSGWRMLRNDQIGNCAIVGVSNLIQGWTSNETQELLLPEETVISTYSRISGYDPATGLNDNGCVLLDVLKMWREQGIDNHKILAYAYVNPRRNNITRSAIYIFGGLYTGFNLPLYIQDKNIWEMQPSGINGDGMPGSWGGHCVSIVGYDELYLYAVSWGMIIKISWDFFETYCDESYALLTKDWITDENAPNGFNMDRLIFDLKNLS